MHRGKIALPAKIEARAAGTAAAMACGGGKEQLADEGEGTAATRATG